ncbi:uncharacterized protein M421DRAFT_426533 [Didymella exigua CBS 183.55]|uniref:Uncharacterized protein n=1 Tax=Didymella exigua CBS 183.55 TaxID=1150837 RepID=A0A6A5R569_9PLEO|nr:uncharacterized protein M421DRAFT_426533 [Didymella exigua CBS 183.55]KAF1922793.1 hypothetical protein M421DRAFT_426533 [Didymella exigua CBS 183.55]
MIGVILSFVITNNGEGWGWETASDGELKFSSNTHSAHTTFLNAWLANMSQVVLSLCYMNLNSFYTTMTSATEWNNLAFTRKGLRVSEPRGEQQSTYFLQLPYRWAMPLIVLGTALHWLLSQTFFLVRIDVFNEDGYLTTEGSRSACGTSVSSFIVFFVVFFGLCIAVRVQASRNLVTGLPQAASNSLVISAACHPPSDEIDANKAGLRSDLRDKGFSNVWTWNACSIRFCSRCPGFGFDTGRHVVENGSTLSANRLTFHGVSAYEVEVFIGIPAATTRCCHDLKLCACMRTGVCRSEEQAAGQGLTLGHPTGGNRGRDLINHYRFPSRRAAFSAAQDS